MTDTKRRTFLHKKPEEERIRELKFELEIPPWENLSKELDKLPDFNRAPLCSRYGVLGEEAMSAKDLSEKYNLSPRLLRSTIAQSIQLLLTLRRMAPRIHGQDVALEDKTQRLDEAMTCLREMRKEGQRRPLLASERDALINAKSAIEKALKSSSS